MEKLGVCTVRSVANGHPYSAIPTRTEATLVWFRDEREQYVYLVISYEKDIVLKIGPGNVQMCNALEV